MYYATTTTNVEHPNAAIGLRLPNSLEYFDAMRRILTSYWKDDDGFEDLDDDDGAIVASMRITTALEQITDGWNRDALIVTYKKFLNIFVERPTRERQAKAKSSHLGLSTRRLVFSAVRSAWPFPCALCETAGNVEGDG